MHLLELNMRLCALAGGKCRVANNVAESLPRTNHNRIGPKVSHRRSSFPNSFRDFIPQIQITREGSLPGNLPFRLVRLIDLSLRMVTNDLDVDKGTNVELLGPI